MLGLPWRGRRRRRLEHHRATARWTQYGRKRSSDRVLVEVYPSKAACNNDPIWGRGGFYSVARPMEGDRPVGGWVRNYIESFETLRGED